MGSDYYRILGLEIDATPEEIRAAYFGAARRLHPDVNPVIPTEEMFLQAKEAYEILSDPQRRKTYDASLGEPAPITPEVLVNIRTSRVRLPRLDETQVLYALLELVCTAESGKIEKPPVHVCLVIDRSTSMAGARIDMVKASIAQGLKHLKPTDMVSVVAFSDRAEVVIPPTRVSALSRVENHIYIIQSGGGTEIYQGLLEGMVQLRSSEDSRAVRQLILFTDGHTYGDEDACIKLAEQAVVEGTSISALGIGSEWNDEFLDRLTGISGGSTSYIANTRDLAAYLEQKMNSLGAVYGRSVRLELQEQPSVELRSIFRLYPDITPLQPATTLPLGSIQHGKSMALLLEFLIEPVDKFVDILQILSGRVKMQVDSERGLENARLFLDLKRTVVLNPEPENTPPAIVEALSRLTMYRMQERARQEVQAGEVGQAAKHLQCLATHLLARGNQELAHTVLVEAEHIRQSHVFSKEGVKRIKYGTRALMLPAGLEFHP